MTHSFPTLRDILQRRAREQPHRVAYIYRKAGELEELPITYAELDQQAHDVASLLRESCSPGDRALLLYPSGLEFIAAFFGCIYAGVIAVPADPPRAKRSTSRLEAIIRDCKASVALATSPVARSLRTRSERAPELDALQWLATDTAERCSQRVEARPALTSGTIAFLQYTSGSTGAPKGVMISHGNLVHNLQCLQDRWGHSATSVGVCWCPQFHDLGLIVGLLQPVYVGFLGVVFPPTAFVQKPYRWLETISRHRGTTTCAPNFAFEHCMRKITPEQRQTLDLSCLETVMNGAEPISSETLRGFSEAFRSCGFSASAFRGGYGLAEGTVFVTTTHRRDEGPKVETVRRSALEQHQVVRVDAAGADTQEVVSCGPPANDQQLLIVDPELHTLCEPEQVGEVWVKGPSVALGYWGRPAESARTFQAALDATNDGPFLRTGDLGFLREGELYITGRTKDLIIVRGRNHYPQDIEKTVERVNPVLRANCAAAFSVRNNDEEQVVVVQEVSRHTGNTSLQEVLASIFQAVLTEHELALHEIVLIDERDISKTSSGKIQRRACRQRYRDNLLSVVHRQSFDVSAMASTTSEAALMKRLYEADADEFQAQVEAYLTRTVRRTRAGFFYIDVHRSLVEIGLDSLGVADLRSAVERDLGVELSDTSLMETPLRELSAQIANHLTSEGFHRSTDTRSRVGDLSDAEVDTLLADMLSL